MKILKILFFMAGWSLLTLACGSNSSHNVTSTGGGGSGGGGGGLSAKTWSSYTIDGTISESQEGQTSIAIDSNNDLHVSYHGSLKYASGASGWFPETLASGDAGYYNSLVIDTSDNVHIVYWNETDDELIHITNESGPWVPSVIDDIDGGKFASVAVDSHGVLHVIYWAHLTGGGLKYATNQSTSWDTYDDVDSSAVLIDAGTSIAVDSGDHLHVSYYDRTNGELKYATNASGAWIVYTVDDTGVTGMYNSIAVDSADHVHISYYDDTNGELEYVTNASGSWSFETVDSTGDTGLHNDIAVDSNDNIHISYHSDTSDRLRYATNESGTWRTFSVDTSNNGSTSIAIGLNDRPYISYYDEFGRLKYAY